MPCYMASTMDTPPSPAGAPQLATAWVPLLSAAFALSFAPSAFAQDDDEPLVSEEDMSGETAESTAEVAASGTAQRILVLPYQPIFRSAEPDKVSLATELVVKELSRGGSLEVVRGGVAKDGASAPTGEKIQASLAAARKARADKNIRAAISAYQSTLKEMVAAPAALEDAQTFIQTHHELARALLEAAEDDKAAAVMNTAARMAPGFDLPASEYSRFYRQRFRAVAKEAVEARPAEILVRSALPGATIFLDGRETRVAPVRLESALPGQHIVQAELEGVPTAAAIITLKPGKNPEFTVSFGETWGGVAVGAVADAIAENQLPANAVKKAVEAGKEASAAFVVAGGMAHDKVAAKFNVHTFVVNVATGGVRQLDLTNFDLDMLTAASDVIQVVRGVEQSVKEFGDAKRAVASIEGKVQPKSIVNPFDAKPDFSSSAGKRPSRRPAGRPAARRPIKVLKGTGSIRIKDEVD
ncbi:MAG: PEGA domain-containing protein [Myxococcota bacterium]